MIRFDDRVAIVTGAGGGLGRQHALLLASRGAAVVVNDPGVAVDGSGSDDRPADRVVEEIRASGGTAVAEHSSVATPEGGEAIFGRAFESYGRVDVVVNNAGILRDRSFANLEWEDLDAVLDVHLRGAFYVTIPAFRFMKEHDYGRIVLTSSGSGLFGNFGQSNYAAAKMGLVGLMNVLKLEGEKYHINVNAVAPIAGTRMTSELLGPLADKLHPEAVAPAVAYLCSEECRLSGEIWSVGGGSVSRVFVGLAPGYSKPAGEGPLGVEEVAEHLDEIRAQEGYLMPASSRDEFLKLGPRLVG